MVLASHVIFSAYGFWLPNDPRGSWSDFVGSWELFNAGGRATKTTERRSLAYDPHDRQRRLATKEALKRKPVIFDERQRNRIAEGFARSAGKGNVKVWACAIMPDHAHFVFERHRCDAELLANFMKGEATKALIAAECHPFLNEREEDGSVPHCWAQGQWKVFLDTSEDIRRAINYVRRNPIKDGMPEQSWDFVTPYENV